ncbi:MAG TPA: hypothetical protein PKD37_07325 [Oligoflexia bacterium]|nr:hypothetical protein [Oligoflexia bacterium]HMP27773.1 hypothetical protein [Oligoflexia bacterium]
MKNSIKKLALALLLATIITPNAWGEEGLTNDGGYHLGGGGIFFNVPDLQKELEIAIEAAEKLIKATEKKLPDNQQP